MAEAEVQYWKVLLERSDDEDLLINLGSALSAQGKFNQAVTCYRRAIAINPENWRTHGNLGNVFKRMGKLDRAQASYQRGIKIDQNIALLHYSLGDVLREKGKLDKAAVCHRKTLKIDPTYIDSFIALSALEQSAGNHEGAKKILRDGISKRPDYTVKCVTKALANVLLFYGLDDCLFSIDGDNNIKVSGGHFQTNDLLGQTKFTKSHYHIIAENLLSKTTSLPPHDLIVNTIACPDRERPSLETLSRYLQEYPHAPLINAPQHVLQTSRDENYNRLHDIKGITFPKTLRLLTSGVDTHSIVKTIEAAEMSYPIIMRRVGTQSARSTEKLSTPDEIDTYLDATRGDEFYAIEYIDCRFRKKYYRKLRLFCIDGKLYPAVCHIDTVWNVHGGNRKTLMKQNTWMQDEEKSFLEDFTTYIGHNNARRLEDLHDIVKLDFYGIDFTIMADNSILIFELNPAMRHSFIHAQALPYLIPHLNRISDAFETMALGKVAAR